MKPLLLSLLIVSFVSVIIHEQTATTAATTTTNGLSLCLVSSNVLNFSMSSPSPSSSYYNLLSSSIRNSRFADTTTPKPVAIVLPNTKYQLQRSVLCCRQSAIAIRIRSGGHSYEGLSYTAETNTTFVVIDLTNLNRVRVNLTSSTAWVESGATVGEIYYSVTTESNGSLAFPAGTCSTVGSGGHIAGGGFGFLARKYGLAADNVLDAILIDANGRVLNRVSMGEEVFWAIRGGGGGNWGAIYAWKLRLIPSPGRVTVFTLRRPSPSQLVAKLVHKWQYVAPGLPDEFYLSTLISPQKGKIAASFTGMYLGSSQMAISVLTQRFPELGLNESDCIEMTWIESVVRFAGLSSTEDLKIRDLQRGGYFKAKSDYVRSPISLADLIKSFEFVSKQPEAYIIFDPYGGAMNRISSTDLPFPHREGNLYGIQYMVNWAKGQDFGREGYMAWLREFYEFMTPFVSMNPRAAYVNYVDLDLGSMYTGGKIRDAVDVGRVWGEKYFLENYDRLVLAKTAIDPNNVFSNVQSIPPLS